MRRMAWALALIVGAAGPSLAGAPPVEPVLNDDGLYAQPWFVVSFLDLKEDLAEAAGKGKRLAILWEQRGCPYCKELHKVNLAQPDINRYVRDNFAVIQLNLWGDRPVTDFDGQELAEKALARKWGIIFTPTIMFFPETVGETAGRSGRDSEVARMPGYFRPFHFAAMFHYVRDKRYTGLHFQSYLDEYAESLRQQGREVNVW